MYKVLKDCLIENVKPLWYSMRSRRSCTFSETSKLVVSMFKATRSLFKHLEQKVNVSNARKSLTQKESN